LNGRARKLNYARDVRERLSSLRRCLVLSFLAVLLALASSQSPQPSSGKADFSNPLLENSPDPWVIYRDGFYYEMNTSGKNLIIRKSHDITELSQADKKIVWTPPPSGPYSHDIWAPELHFLDGKWYIYFAADAGTNRTHRIWVLQNDGPDPLSDGWVFKGQLTDRTNKWAIDPTVFEDAGKLYAVWSGWPGDKNGEQDIYIAALSNPWTITGRRHRLSSPKYEWEKFGSQASPFVAVNEGPEILKHGHKLFLVYSASGCWTDHYALGMLTAEEGTDLLNPKSWKKSPEPLFWSAPASHAYGPGHNGFFKSPDGTQDWIAYHANPEPHEGCGGHRSLRIQQFTWNSDGTPDLGKPVPLDKAIPKPSDE
jgi:GH43 family beta-xylosidase